MRRLTFGCPEEIVPTKFCRNLNYQETEVQYPYKDILFKETARGCKIELPLEIDEEVFGLGLQLKGFGHKNRKMVMRVNADPIKNTGDSHAPVPFFVTNKGYGIYVDTARCAEFYIGFNKLQKRTVETSAEVMVNTTDLYANRLAKNKMVIVIDIPVAKGVDLYFFSGDTITDIVAEYNMFSGGGCNVPEWGLGMFYRCYSRYTEDQVLEAAKYFRDNNIPCDIIGLEPGWQTHSYSCSYVWNQDNYPHYKETVKSLMDLGYHINLWEHAFINSASPLYDKMYQYGGDFEVWKGVVPDFANEQAQDIFAKYHRENFVDLGIDGFKLDECDNSDFTGSWSFPNCTEFESGLDGEQYHNLFGTLYMQTMLKALQGKETLSEVRSAGALCASYPFVLYSDLYDHEDFIRGVVNAGFSGLLWAPEVREGKNKKDFIRRLQTAVFSVQCLINAWYCERLPWLDLDCEEEVRNLLNERQKLIPMLKEAFNKYEKTGVAPIRALVMDYSDDVETYSIDNQYLFCENLLVAPITEKQNDERKIYIPQGEWYDYWTKERVNNGWIIVKSENIPVYERRI